MAIEESTEDLTCRFEVLLAGEQWLPYTASALGVDEYEIDVEYAGDRDMIGSWQEPTDFARAERDKALGDLTGEEPGLGGLRGLRVLVWLQQPGGARDVGRPRLGRRHRRREPLGAGQHLAAAGLHVERGIAPGESPAISRW